VYDAVVETRPGQRDGEGTIVTEGVFTPAYALAQAILQREVSSAEVVDAYLARIAYHNPQLNAVVTLDEDGARQRAQEADAALGRGEVWGALHDMPITLEDLHPTSGIRSTWGGLPRFARLGSLVQNTVTSVIRFRALLAKDRTESLHLAKM
jgi:amidase